MDISSQSLVLFAGRTNKDRENPPIIFLKLFLIKIGRPILLPGLGNEGSAKHVSIFFCCIKDLRKALLVQAGERDRREIEICLHYFYSIFHFPHKWLILKQHVTWYHNKVKQHKLKKNQTWVSNIDIPVWAGFLWNKTVQNVQIANGCASYTRTTEGCLRHKQNDHFLTV